MFESIALESPQAPPAGDDLLLFEPVTHLRTSARGWTSDRQVAFIAALRRTGVVAAAARSVGMTPSAAYQLRKRAGPESGFERAWCAALCEGQMRALDVAKERSFEPMREAVWFRGRQVGWRTRHDNRLVFAALRALDGMHERWFERGQDPDRFLDAMLREEGAG